MRDVYDIEHAKGDGHTDCDRGIKAAEQEAGDDCIDREIDRDH
jgi:hypothetical protein